MMKTNFHTHTFRCGHAVGNEEAMVKSAIEEGIEEMCIRDRCKYTLKIMDVLHR